MMSARLGDILLDDKRVTGAQLQEALARQRANGRRLGFNLIRLGVLGDDEITAILSRQFGVPSIDLSRFEVDPAAIAIIPADAARKYQLVPLHRAGTTLTVAMADPTNVFALDDVEFMTGCHVDPVIASEGAVLQAIERYYGGRPAPPANTLEAAAKALEELSLVPAAEVEVLEPREEIDAAALEREGRQAPVIRLVNLLLMSAIQRGASDIHIEPYERELRVRFRIDGRLQHAMTPALRLRDAMASRVKIMARLDIAEKRLPQDGRIKIRVSDEGRSREIDFRVSTLPTLFGEKIVLRVLDRDTLALGMAALGLEPGPRSCVETAIRKPWGLVLVTGPTGSGKTSTLYSAISALHTPETNILTVEDPVEFNLPGVNQVQVRDGIGLSFAAVLRSFLRQDPNVILVGEVRDPETASIAVKAALTGHLVLTTLHTNDAPSAITRLTEMGIEPFLVASSLNVICAQRLVRRLCPSCRAPHRLPPAALEEIGFDPEEASRVVPFRAAGCDRCHATGYRGRIGLYEVMAITEEIRDLILAGAPARALRREAIEQGMITLRQSGLQKVRDGVTTIEDVVRETVR